MKNVTLEIVAFNDGFRFFLLGGLIFDVYFRFLPHTTIQQVGAFLLNIADEIAAEYDLNITAIDPRSALGSGEKAAIRACITARTAPTFNVDVKSWQEMVKQATVDEKTEHMRQWAAQRKAARKNVRKGA